MRDYIHVMDLAKGHVAAVKKLDSLTGEVRRMSLFACGTSPGELRGLCVGRVEFCVGRVVEYVV